MHVVVIVLRSLGDHDLGGQQQAGDRRGVLQRKTRDLRRVEDAEVEHVAILTRGGVVAVGTLAGLDLIEDHGGIFAGVLDDLTQRLFDRAGEDADADRLVFVRTFELVERLGRTDQRDTAGELGNALLQLFLVVVDGGFFEPSPSGRQTLLPGRSAEAGGRSSARSGFA